MYFIGDWCADCGILYEILEGIQFYSGSERQKMVKHANNGEKGSMLYGRTWKGYLKKDKVTGEKIYREKDEIPGYYKTKVKAENPDLQDVFEEFKQLYFADFDYTSVQMNRNFNCPPHKDSANVGESILVCLGEYTGGELMILGYPNPGENVIDNNNGLYRFNGSKYIHWVKPHVGTRYSLVFFNDKNQRKKIDLLKNN